MFYQSLFIQNGDGEDGEDGVQRVIVILLFANTQRMVAILEPFIDTICICTLTGLVLLSSGVWNQKIENQFQETDMQFVVGEYDENNEEDRLALFHHVNFVDGWLAQSQDNIS